MDYKRATFAGGCFWCMEAPFEKLDGVINAVVGYSGGHTADPTYQEVIEGTTGHLETVQITFDPAKISYQKLLEVFWKQIDPEDAQGQFADRGSQYRTAVFFHDQAQKRQAVASKNALEASGRFNNSIATVIRPFESFFPAESYHQNFYKKQPVHYRSYRLASGREGFLNRVWRENETNDNEREQEGKHEVPDDAILKKRLTPLEYYVARENGTEPPFKNAYWDNKQEGIYVDVVSGEPLFSSIDKYDSGTGWPSFTQPIAPDSIVETRDARFGMVRTEVKSRLGDTHLGHRFDDGPTPDGLRYCVNSASLRFIPKEELVSEGYGEYLRLFQ